MSDWMDGLHTRVMMGLAAGDPNAQATKVTNIEQPPQPGAEELREAFDAIMHGYRQIGASVRVAAVAIDRFGSIYSMTRVRREPFVWVRKGARKTRRLPGWVPVGPSIKYREE